MSSELHCAESESGDTAARVELVLVEPVDPTFIHDSARLQLRLQQQLLRGRVLSPPRREDQIQILREYVWHQNKY